MKLFLKKSLFFLLIGTLLVFLFFPIDYIYNKRVEKLILDRNISTLICGASHLMCSLDDKIIPNSTNTCLPAESYYYTYYKLKKILLNDNNLKYILLGLSFSSFRENFDSHIYGIGMTSYMYPKYFLILENREKLSLLKKNPIGLLKSIPYIYKKAFIAFFKSNKYTNYPFWGSFSDNENTNLSDKNIKAAINLHYYDTDSDLLQNFFCLQLEYLMKIIDLCTKKNIRLYLINAPVSNEYFYKIPEKFVNHYYNIIKKLKSNRNVKILDYHNYQLPKNCFGDADHLNSNGAKIFSEKIISEINNLQ
ncbi:hypothetical protein ES705_38760 [subsurface metagenome]